MDWKYKHFNQAAVFKAMPQSVLAAARAVMGEAFGGIEDSADGFVARGNSAWHTAQVTFHITPAPEGTQVAVELLVERAAMRGYMLFDIGGYYNGQIDKWFTAITGRLGDTQEQPLVSKTSSDPKARRGCLAGCLVYLLVGVCLVIISIPLDRNLFPKLSGSTLGPFGILASVLGFLAGLAVFLYFMYPDARASRFIRERLNRNRNKKSL
jgi:hypothetical protein